MSYLAIKHMHMSFAILSGLLFLGRGIMMLAGSTLLQKRVLRIAPHVIDTLLLASALALVFISGMYPFVQAWLTAKVLALVGYIVAGSVALRPGRSRGVRATAFVVALLLFAYILKVAVTKQPLL
ncbi:SirB2 family protein [Noviherbaspirillum aridicola]|uniref:SirB family protein n=1 Tax=Noviherbaspirillum aridicola TaxID=2849687 RepID=A0ABQ4PYS4_9BURK|nr:SirB2 family protein [Noviherbaspirillum aridicola]GIZ50028.1 SirB family protein [Noviherbaspirillum aridicola]